MTLMNESKHRRASIHLVRELINIVEAFTSSVFKFWTLLFAHFFRTNSFATFPAWRLIKSYTPKELCATFISVKL